MKLFFDVLPYAVLLVLNITAYKKCKEGFSNGGRPSVLQVVIGSIVIGILYSFFKLPDGMRTNEQVFWIIRMTLFIGDIVWCMAVNFYENIWKISTNFMERLADKYKHNK